MIDSSKWLVVAGAMLALVLSSPGHAQDAFYKGKRLTMIISNAAGGPADLEGRVFAKHLARHLDGQPTIVIQNIDGGGGLVGSKYVGEVAARDGTVIGALTGAAWLYAASQDRWPVDFRSYEFVGRQPSTTIHFVRKDVAPGMNVPSDIVKAQDLIAGGLAADVSKDVRMRLVLDMLGIPFKYVTGYRSSAPARVAVLRGEINFFSESPASYRTGILPQLIEPGLAIPICYDEVVEPVPDSTRRQLEGLVIPSFLELYRSVKGKAPSGPLWDAYRTIYQMNSTLLRLLAFPPSTPPAAIDAISQGIRRMAVDQEFIADATKVLGYVPFYETAPDMSEQVRTMMTISPAMLTYIKDYTRNVPKR